MSAISVCDLILDVQSQFLAIGVAFEEDQSPASGSDQNWGIGRASMAGSRSTARLNRSNSLSSCSPMKRGLM